MYIELLHAMVGLGSLLEQRRDSLRIGHAVLLRQARLAKYFV